MSLNFLLWLIVLLLAGMIWGGLMGILFPGVLGLVLAILGGGLMGYFGANYLYERWER